MELERTVGGIILTAKDRVQWSSISPSSWSDTSADESRGGPCRHSARSGGKSPPSRDVVGGNTGVRQPAEARLQKCWGQGIPSSPTGDVDVGGGF